MAKQISPCIGGVVKKVKKVPVCIGGVVKEAKKGVGGVGGVVREFFTAELVLYDNGATNYTWSSNANDNGSVLQPGVNTFYITESIDISNYTKCGITFTDSTVSTNTYCNANVRFYDKNYSSSFTIVDSGYTRNPGGTVTKMFDLNEDDKLSKCDTTSVRPAWLFQLWEDDWYGNNDYWNGRISKIWFE